MCASAAAAQRATASQRSPQRKARTRPTTAIAATGVKTSRPLAGETSRPACPTPQGSEKRAGAAAEPVRERRAEGPGLYASTSTRPRARRTARTAGCAAASARAMATPSTAGQHDVGVARGHRQRERQAGASRPHGSSSARTRHSSARRQEQHGRGVLPERLARGPDGRAQREHDRGPEPLHVRAPPAAHGQEQHGRGRGRTGGDAASLPARAVPVSSRSNTTDASANTGAASTAESTG